MSSCGDKNVQFNHGVETPLYINQMLITRQLRIDMGHRVPNHKSKCRHLHGHSYTIELGVDDKVITTKGASNEGMVIDYGDLKEILKSEIEDNFDHRFIYFKDDIYLSNMIGSVQSELGFVSVDFIPTAENLAKHWYELLEVKLKQRDIAIKYVRVWETPSSTATYEK